MVQTLFNHNAVDEVSSTRDTYVKAYRVMLLARILDDKFASLYRMGKIHGGVFLGRGQEALSVSVGLALRKGDIFAPLIRDGAGRLAFGEPILDGVRTYLGSSLGPMRGRDGNIHRGRPKEGLLAMISHLGAMISVVNGALLAHRLKGITGTVGRGLRGRRRDFHRCFSRGRKPGGGGETAAGGHRRQQPLRLFHPHRAAVCLPLAPGQGGRLRARRTRSRWHRFVRLPQSSGERSEPGEGRSRPANGRCPVAAPLRSWRA